MCTFESNPLGAILNTTIGITNETLNFIDEKKNNEYRTRVALNNAKIAQSEALRQQQLGIEQSRLEKISGIQEANKLKARFASSNLDVNSLSNQLNYQDNLSFSDYKANLTERSYNATAQNYLNQSINYLNQAKNYQQDYNNSVFQNALNALGKTNKVAGEWYEGKQGGIW